MSVTRTVMSAETQARWVGPHQHASNRPSCPHESFPFISCVGRLSVSLYLGEECPPSDVNLAEIISRP